MLKSIRSRGVRVAAGAAAGIAALALSAAFPSTAVAEEQQPYDVQLTAILVKDPADAKRATVHTTIVNKGTTPVDDAFVGVSQLHGTMKVLDTAGEGFDECTDYPPAGVPVSLCRYNGTLAPGQAVKLKLTVEIDPEADLNEGRGVAGSWADLEGDIDDTNEADNYAVFATGKKLTQAPSLAGHVWNDKNKDGLQDEGEPGVGNVPVTLTRDGVTVYETKTADSGNYQIDTLWTGSYVITVKAPEGYTNAPAGVGKDEARNSDVNEDGTRELVCEEEEVPEPQAEDFLAKAQTLSGDVEVPKFCSYDIDAALLEVAKPKPAPGKGGDLAVTGTNVGVIAGTGAALVAAGGAAVIAMRRRRVSAES